MDCLLIHFSKSTLFSLTFVTLELTILRHRSFNVRSPRSYQTCCDDCSFRVDSMDNTCRITPCLGWIKRGVAQEIPNKVKLTLEFHSTLSTSGCRT